MEKFTDNLITKNILCFDKYSFDDWMEHNGWIDSPPKGVSCISICAPGEGEFAKHWFKHDYKDGLKYNRVFNLDIDDHGPFWFGKHEADCYDKSLALYNDNKVKLSNAYFNNVYISGSNREFCSLIHVLDYEEAFALVKWIDFHIKHDDTIYIHCAAGVSRSQGVVRYILDTYGDEYDIKTNPNNPCLTPNVHVVLMLKRACRHLYYYGNTQAWDPSEKIEWDKEAIKEYTKDIKINFI